MHDTLIIGGGHNGLAAAFYLAKAGRKPIVLERREVVGGGAITGELHPGFRCPTLSHEVLLHRQIVREMDLVRRGVQFHVPDVEVCSPSLDGPPIVLYRERERSADSIRRRHAKDGDAFPRFRAAVEHVVSVLASVFTTPPPAIDEPSGRDLWNLLKAGRTFRSLGKRDGYRLLRWGPMAVADLVDEWFEDDLLRATVAAPGLSGTMLGPRSAGSSLALLAREAHQHLAGARSLRVRGGPGALTQAMAAAATEAGAEIRTSVRVDRILVRDERVLGVVADGHEIPASVVVSAIDPKSTFLNLVDATHLTPDFAAKVRNIRANGTVAKINLALSGSPTFAGVSDLAAISGRIHVGPTIDYLEQAFDCAKYGGVSSAPWLDVTVPSVIDDTLAPAGAHVASIYVHYAPYALRHSDWATTRDKMLAAVMTTLETYAPGIKGQVVAAQVVTPTELEAEYGFAGGHIFHGELALDQLFTMRPLLGYAKYDSPIRGLHLCGAGTHPGGFLTGASGRLAAQEILRK